MLLFNRIDSLDTSFSLKWGGYAGNYAQSQYWVKGFTRPNGNSGNNPYSVTTGHAQGFRLNFLPYDKNYLTGSSKAGMISGRIEVFAHLKQSAAEITVA